VARLFRKTKHKLGRSPGSIEFTGERKVDKTRIRVIDYDPESLEEKELLTAEDCSPYRDLPPISWINFDGLHETDLLEKVAIHFGVHPLVMEDVVNPNQRPKIEDHQDHLFIVFRMVYFDEETLRISAEQISMIVGSNYVLSFQEKPGDVFEHVRERLRKGKGRLRTHGPDYLAYALLDAVVDHYFVVLERVGENIESLEEQLLENPSPELLQDVHRLKREMILLRKSIWPLREVVAALERTESDLIQEKLGLYLRDLYDHTIQVVEAVESFRDILSGLQDLYLSSISNRMNEVMKVLTIAATIFVPLTFVAGIYGMNFDHMPELHWRFAYPVFWAVILILGGGMLLFFSRRRWL